MVNGDHLRKVNGHSQRPDHRETKTLKIRDHMDLKGAQFFDRINDNFFFVIKFVCSFVDATPS